MNKSLANLLIRSSYYGSPIEEKRLLKDVLENSKRERKNLTKEEIEKRGLQVYEKKNNRVSDLLEEAINEGLIKRYTTNDEPKVFITKEGLDYLFNFYTNHQSYDFELYEKNLNDVMREKQGLELKRLQTAALYWRGYSVEDAAHIYLKHNCYREEIQAYHHYLLQEFGVNFEEDMYIFHMIPKLFVPIDWVNEKVSLTIEGIETPSNLILTKPYPNKRYTVAGLKIGKVKTAAGFYPIIANKDTFPKELDVTLHWTVGNTMKVIHKIHIDFEMSDHGGNLFSSEQHLSRSSKLNELHLTTYVQPDRSFWRERQHNLSLANGFEELLIEERVALTHFPIELHAAFHGDCYFQKWRETKSRTKEKDL
ncbi:hypothetical protein ACFVS2_22245 [Brevibacillus sp. NPDC058079]|uniref:hypothetical protein n=1 Tax=Brevibacillus sp. NPDC058079 TaxID=3346330 RepID=UPI0036E44BB6